MSKIHVEIGNLKKSESPDVLKAILGSCVGIAFLVPSRKIYALAHCLLPFSEEAKEGLTARYVNHAVPSLFEILGMDKCESSLIRAVVAGGANMYGESKHSILKIGEMNVKTALNELKNYKVEIIHQDTGEAYGRQIIVDCNDGSYTIRNLNEDKWKP